MDVVSQVLAPIALAPMALMLLALLWPRLTAAGSPRLWSGFNVLSVAALVCAVLAAFGPGPHPETRAWLVATPLGAVLAVLVQFLGTVIGVFSSRFLQGEARQPQYVAALGAVLAAVHLLLLADHWVVLIAAWALVGTALQHLLCFYPDRPFALLAAHKKRLADRAADVLLLAAAGLAWWSVGSGSFTGLAAHLQQHGASPALQVSAVLLVLAVVLRTALLPVHGWLIQVMEAPTPVSALLHAGVVNLGGYVLIRFAPLLEQSAPARWLLVVLGLGTAVLAGLVMLTRISIKVRLAWSTTAQMGFMVMECGLGLYTLAALHLVGHSLYKAHAFLSASAVVRQTRLQALRTATATQPAALWLAPLVAVSLVAALQGTLLPGAWPWWWSVLLGLAWAPLLWLPKADTVRARVVPALAGLLMIAGLAAAALLAHAVPLGIHDAPYHAAGVVALAGMAALYLCLALLRSRPGALAVWRRWSYAGFYVDEFYTRLTLWLWPTRWAPESTHATPTRALRWAAPEASR